LFTLFCVVVLLWLVLLVEWSSVDATIVFRSLATTAVSETNKNKLVDSTKRSFN
jgi:hypothetical protein